MPSPAGEPHPCLANEKPRRPLAFFPPYAQNSPTWEPKEPSGVDMSDVTRILNAIERGDPKATDELLPLVYDELRLLAAQKLSHEPPGQTLQATALVHEAYLRLLADEPESWNIRGHFF